MEFNMQPIKLDKDDFENLMITEKSYQNISTKLIEMDKELKTILENFWEYLRNKYNILTIGNAYRLINIEGKIYIVKDEDNLSTLLEDAKASTAKIDEIV